MPRPRAPWITIGLTGPERNGVNLKVSRHSEYLKSRNTGFYGGILKFSVNLVVVGNLGDFWDAAGFDMRRMGKVGAFRFAVDTVPPLRCELSRAVGGSRLSRV